MPMIFNPSSVLGTNNVLGDFVNPSTLVDGFSTFTYKNNNGNGNSYIKLGYVRKMRHKVAPAGGFGGPFWTITIDNNKLFTLSFTTVTGPSPGTTVLANYTAPNAGGTAEQKFYVAFKPKDSGPVNEDKIIFGRGKQIGSQVLLRAVVPSVTVLGVCQETPRYLFVGTDKNKGSTNEEFKFDTECMRICPKFDHGDLILRLKGDNFEKISATNPAESCLNKHFWRDVSPVANHLESSCISVGPGSLVLKTTVNGHGAVKGDAGVAMNVDCNSDISLNEHLLPDLFTLVIVARRKSSSAAKKAPFQAGTVTKTSYFGFGPSGQVPYSKHYPNVITNFTGNKIYDPNVGTNYALVDDDKFLVVVAKRSLFRAQGVELTTNQPSVVELYKNFGINHIVSGSDSNFEVAEILVYKSELPLDHICCLEYELATHYGFGGAYQKHWPKCCVLIEEEMLIWPVQFLSPPKLSLSYSAHAQGKEAFLKEETERNVKDNSFRAIAAKVFFQKQTQLSAVLFSVVLIINLLLVMVLGVLCYANGCTIHANSNGYDYLKNKNQYSYSSDTDLKKWQDGAASDSDDDPYKGGKASFANEDSE